MRETASHVSAYWPHAATRSNSCSFVVIGHEYPLSDIAKAAQQRTSLVANPAHQPQSAVWETLAIEERASEAPSV